MRGGIKYEKRREAKGEVKRKEGLWLEGEAGEDEGEPHSWYHRWPGQSSASCRPCLRLLRTQGIGLLE